jgi:outer membrane protein TolC
VQSGVKQAEGGVLAADAEARSARLALGSLIGRPGEEVFPEGGLDLTLLATETPDLNAWQERPEIAALKQRTAAVERLTAAAQGAFLPALSAQAAWHYGKPGINTPANDWMDYAVAGLNLSWTLWDWKARSLRVQKAESAARLQQTVLRQTEDAVRTQLQTAVVQLDATRAGLTVAAERVGLVRDRRRMVEARLQQGMATESELLDAEDDLRQAETDLVRAQVRVRMAETEMLYALGKGN